ncbi:hypothetical protein AC579_976 [Pseudocercospora musae]|uniref:Uncharacterized protein n=1 Tax=Pseudocercospora musae TaxID=113226 RepID=A0A139IUJ6_9PEZI|nr:hypothetical protein AC579_976 [Pseudocercospora musae]
MTYVAGHREVILSSASWLVEGWGSRAGSVRALSFFGCFRKTPADRTEHETFDVNFPRLQVNTPSSATREPHLPLALAITDELRLNRDVIVQIYEQLRQPEEQIRDARSDVHNLRDDTREWGQGLLDRQDDAHEGLQSRIDGQAALDRKTR